MKQGIWVERNGTFLRQKQSLINLLVGVEESSWEWFIIEKLCSYFWKCSLFLKHNFTSLEFWTFPKVGFSTVGRFKKRVDGRHSFALRWYLEGNLIEFARSMDHSLIQELSRERIRIERLKTFDLAKKWGIRFPEDDGDRRPFRLQEIQTVIQFWFGVRFDPFRLTGARATTSFPLSVTQVHRIELLPPLGEGIARLSPPSSIGCRKRSLFPSSPFSIQWTSSFYRGSSWTYSAHETRFLRIPLPPGQIFPLTIAVLCLEQTFWKCTEWKGYLVGNKR